MSFALDGVSPRSRRTDPVTSVDAGRWADWGTSQGQVIRFLLEGRRHRFWMLKTFVPAVRAWAESIGDDVFSESLYRRLREVGVIIPGSRLPYQRYSHHFKIVARTITDGAGNSRSVSTTKLRPSGLPFILKKLGADAAVSA